MSRSVNSQFSFADWELLRQGVVLQPSLAAIADFLDEHEEIIEAIRGDLRCGLKRPDTGRKGLTAQQVLRSLILMRVKNWDYRELRERIADGLTLRQFADFNAQRVPKHDAFQRAFTRLGMPCLPFVLRYCSACGNSRPLRPPAGCGNDASTGAKRRDARTLCLLVGILEPQIVRDGFAGAQDVVGRGIGLAAG